METTHENSRFRSQLLEKTLVLNHALLARLKSQFLPSATATVATDSGITLTHVKTEGVIPPSLPKNRERDYLVTEPKIQLSDVKKSHFTLNSSLLKIQEVDSSLNRLKTQLSEKISQNGNYGFLPQLNKINQLSFFDSFNCVDKVAVTVNNARQELRKLSVSVLQHHTIVDVFLCLSFANCLFTGELRLALALVRLWWGGDGNKSFIGRIPSAVLLRFSNLPTALSLGQPSKNLPFEKVQ